MMDDAGGDSVYDAGGVVDGVDLEDAGASYVMGEIVVDDGNADDSFLGEYTEEVDDSAEKSNTKDSDEGDEGDSLEGNPHDTDDFAPLEDYDPDEDWPLE